MRRSVLLVPAVPLTIAAVRVFPRVPLVGGGLGENVAEDAVQRPPVRVVSAGYGHAHIVTAAAPVLLGPNCPRTGRRGGP